jgi:23S rRNA (uracil1939-C5)-methyltransferase
MSKLPLFDLVPFDYSNDGSAVAKLPDGRVIFIPFVLPGEKVRTQVVQEKKGFARGMAVGILEISPQRIQPVCAHFTHCGGCHYQHLGYVDQLATKTRLVADQLKRIGGIPLPIVQPSLASSLIWNYRNALQFHLADNGRLGFLAPDSHEIVPISECHLPEKSLNSLWPLLDFESGLELSRVELRLGSDDQTMVVLFGDRPFTPEFSTELPTSVVFVNDGQSTVLAGDPWLRMQIHDRFFQVSPLSFFQVNFGVAEKLVTHLLEELPPSRNMVLLDVYCGVGLFTSFLADKFQRVAAVELSLSACADFAVNLDEFDNVELYVGKAEMVLPELDIHPNVVIVDPPRSGVELAAMNTIISMKPELIFYISCDPATLARDARRLIGAGYQLKQVTPFDMFPQTYHIETVSIFTV